MINEKREIDKAGCPAICPHCGTNSDYQTSCCRRIESVVTQIAEAEREAFRSGCNTHLAICNERFKEGFAAARKKAKGIAEREKVNNPDSDFQEGVNEACNDIADRIGRMKP